MSNQTPNLPRSFAALIVGNVIAILVSTVISLLICQTFFPDFFQTFLERGRAVKALKKLESGEDAENQEAKGKGNPKKDDKSRDSKGTALDEGSIAKLREKAEKQIDFPFGCTVAFFACDVIFAALAGCICVWIARNAKFSHALLLALLIGVFKFQAVLGFVENQIPKTLLTIELIAAPLACMFGASFQFETNESQGESETDKELERAFDPEHRSIE